MSDTYSFHAPIQNTYHIRSFKYTQGAMVLGALCNLIIQKELSNLGSCSFHYVPVICFNAPPFPWPGYGAGQVRFDCPRSAGEVRGVGSSAR